MNSTDAQLSVVDAVNQSEIHSLDRLLSSGDPKNPDSIKQFETAVEGIHAAILHSFKITGRLSLAIEDPSRAAGLWQSYIQFCDDALRVLNASKEKFQRHAGASDLYDLTLDYRNEASNRRQQNHHAAECLKMGIPEGLFPTNS
jgi:hypothetical protein